MGRLLYTDLAEKVYSAEQITKKKGNRVEKVIKLHRYSGHASGDSLWRIIENSSNPDK